MSYDYDDGYEEDLEELYDRLGALERGAAQAAAERNIEEAGDLIDREDAEALEQFEAEQELYRELYDEMERLQWTLGRDLSEDEGNRVIDHVEEQIVQSGLMDVDSAFVESASRRPFNALDDGERVGAMAAALEAGAIAKRAHEEPLVPMLDPTDDDERQGRMAAAMEWADDAEPMAADG